MKLFKYLWQHKLAILLIVLLLIGQAFFDLMLPNYTSQIVDVGIQQAGVEHVATDELSALTHDRISESAAASTAADFDKQLFADSYQLNTQTGTYELTEYGRQHRQQLDIMMARPLAAARDMLSDDATDALVGQVGIAAARAEYKDLGYDMGMMQFNYLLITGLKMMGFVVGAVIISILVSLIAARTAAAIGRDLREKLFRKVISFSDAEIQRFSTASLITRSTNDIQQIQMMSTMFLRMVLYAPILAIGGIIMVAQTDFSMSWIIGVAIGVILLIMIGLMAITMPKFRIMQKLIDRLNLISRERITGVSVVRAFGQQQREETRFEGTSTDLMKTQLFTNRTMTFLMPTIMLIMNLLSVGIVWFGAGQIDAGAMQTGDMIAFITYSMIIVMGFMMLGMLAIMLPRADVSASRVDEVLACPVSIHDHSGQDCCTWQPEAAAIEFDNVSFCYADDCEQVLRDVTFRVEPGETCAIIGSTGSGKSTICKLIERFYDVNEGAVRINGCDVRDVPLAQLRSQIGYVPQKSFLFEGTIATNVGFSEDDMSDERVLKAIEIAQATELVEASSEGIEAPITQGGANVSGGQRQRLAIARALATDAPILVFDDSFSALDYKTDANLRHALAEQLPGRTQLIVAQRIATVMNANHIIVLDDGQIVGQGTHEQLLASCTEYREIAESQLSPEELAKGQSSQGQPASCVNDFDTSSPLTSNQGGDAQ